MTLVVPTTPTVIRRWSLPFSAIADAAGVASVAVARIQPEELAEVERMLVRSNSGTATTFSLYAGSVDLSNLLTQSDNGNADEWEGAALVPGGVELIGRWEGATAGALCVVRVQAKQGPADVIASVVTKAG